MRLRGLVAPLLAFVALPAAAGERAADQVSAFAGSFSQGVPIQVPAFRGLEPRLALGYSSEGRNGQLGVGWGLSGFSTIERTNPGGGTPRFDSTDIYMLDGQKLMACPVGSVSPSCTSGGTHTTETESYVRVVKTASNTFEVTGRDGSKTTYTSLISFTPGTWRWGISTITDTSGNSVAYSWTCGSGDTDCYPAGVSYNGHSITIYRESRADTRSYASYDTVRASDYRLRSILVKVGANNIRAYKLGYGTSAMTDRSLLTSVTMYGKDVVIGGDGAITGGTSAPAKTFAYSTEPAGKVFVGEDTPPTPPGTTETVAFTNATGATLTGTGGTVLKDGGGFAWNAGASSTRALDSGNGYIEWTNTGDKYAIGLSNGDGDATRNDIDFAIAANYTASAEVWEAGINKASTSSAAGDVLRIEVSGGVVLYKRNGITFYSSNKPIVYPLLVDTSIYSRPTTIGPVTMNGTLEDVAFWCNEVLTPADVNGDGLSDQACFSSVGDGFVNVRLATADGFAPPQTWLAGKKFRRPMLADFNADGKLDVADHATLGGAVSVGLSNGSSFAAPVSWGVASDPGGGLCAGNSGDTFNVSTGDFNGDGLTDVACRKFGTNGVYVGTSTGTAFTFSKWINISCDEYNLEWSGTTDFNADGKDDYFCVSAAGQLVVYPSTGTDFVTTGFSGTGAFTPTPAFGDFNGDGRTDLAHTDGRVALSTGSGFTILGTANNWCTNATGMTTGDLDGDGATELICNKSGAGATDIQVRKWKAGALAAAETWKANWCDGSIFPSDYDGDGKTDLVCNKQAATRAIAGTSGGRADLLVSIGNGLGGTTQVAYVPGTVFHDPTANTPVVKNIVAQITTLDGRGGSSTRSYSYAGAFYNRAERRFMGFRYMRETLPCITGESLCPYDETWLLQDLNSAGKVDEFHRRDGQGRLLTSSKYEYAANGATLPRTSLLTSEWTYIGDATQASWEGTWPNPVARRTRSVHSYDTYGNRTQTVSHGDYDSTGDETTTVWEYRPNGTAFIVGALARTRVFAGTSTLGTPLTETRNLFDGSQAWDAPPSDGLLTGSQAWLDTESRFVTKGFGYDAYGNLTSATDETNRTTTMGYDLTHHVFLVSVTNNAGDTTTQVWDPACGVPASSTDLNSQVTTFQTDALCRPTRTDYPLGNFQQISYLSLGDPNSQNVKVEAPSASPSDGTGHDYAMNYFDGLGRGYLAVKKGPSPSETINVETTYNARGGVASKTAPYYAGDTKYWTSYEFDAFDRPVRTEMPDGNDVATAYGLLSTTRYDPNNKAVASRFNIFGRTVETEATLGGSPVLTQYAYDLSGRMVGIEDAVGNTWAFSFDSLGRNYAKDDPDAGAWSHDFDDAGRQTAVVDAKGQRTEFAYDVAGRLQTKTIIGTPNQVTTFSYGEMRAGFYNLGKLTTATSPADTVKTDYDAAGRPVKQTRTLGGIDYTVERRYDSAGRALGVTYPDGDALGIPAVPLTYDAAGRITGIPGVVGSVTYAASGQPLVQTNANGTVTTRSYAADRGFLTGIQTMAGSTTIQNLGYSVDPAGLVQQVTSPLSNESWSYGYDDLYRLTQATSPSNPGESQSWTFDEIGRITYNSRVGAYTYPATGQPRPHAPVSAGSNIYSYDANGNLYSGGGRSITWNANNLPSAVAVSGSTTSFTYSGLGERLSKQTGSAVSLYPLGDDYEITGGVVTKYVSVQGLGVVAKRVNSTTYWLHQDRLGSITAVTDSSGAVAQRRSFRANGETIASQTGHVESRGWIGQRSDVETGLTYLHARYYDPAVGSFLSPDPSHPTGPGVGLNRYGYAAGNPVNLIDPSGLKWVLYCTVVEYHKTGEVYWQDCRWDYSGPDIDPSPAPGPTRDPRGGPGRTDCPGGSSRCDPKPVCPGDPSCTEDPPIKPPPTCVPGDPACDPPGPDCPSALTEGSSCGDGGSSKSAGPLAPDAEPKPSTTGKGLANATAWWAVGAALDLAVAELPCGRSRASARAGVAFLNLEAAVASATVSIAGFVGVSVATSGFGTAVAGAAAVVGAGFATDSFFTATANGQAAWDEFNGICH